jgi:hypothetical protein
MARRGPKHVVSKKRKLKGVNVLKLCCDWRRYKEPVKGSTMFPVRYELKFYIIFWRNSAFKGLLMLTYNIHIKKRKLNRVNVLKLCCDWRRHKEPATDHERYKWQSSPEMALHIDKYSLSDSNKNMVLGPRWGLASRFIGRLTVGRNITLSWS